MTRSSSRSLVDLQNLFKEVYIVRDLSRGADKTLLWLASELGELTDAYLKQEVNSMKEEAADVFAWLCSFCNLAGIDLEEAVIQKYGKGCPRCSSSPCKCPII